MNRLFEHHGTTFRRHDAKSAENVLKHGASFIGAAIVFDDSLFCVRDSRRATTAEEALYDQ